MFYGVFVDSRGRGGPLWNVFMRVYFDVFRQSMRFNFRPSKQSSFYVYGVFVDSRGRGNPCKTYSWGSNLTFFDKHVTKGAIFAKKYTWPLIKVWVAPLKHGIIDYTEEQHGEWCARFLKKCGLDIERTLFWWATINTRTFLKNVKIDPQVYVIRGPPPLLSIKTP